MVGVEVNDETLERGRQHLENSTDRAVSRGKLSEEDQRSLLGRITLTTELDDLKAADLVVEAVVESVELKQDIFRRLDDIVSPDAVPAHNPPSPPLPEHTGRGPWREGGEDEKTGWE